MAQKTYLVAKEAYNAKNSDELSFAAGDMILLIERKVTGWCIGQLRNKIGFFPENYTQAFVPCKPGERLPLLPRHRIEQNNQEAPKPVDQLYPDLSSLLNDNTESPNIIPIHPNFSPPVQQNNPLITISSNNVAPDPRHPVPAPRKLKEKPKNISDIVIGIDLGTTYSCVAVLQNGRVDIISNSEGERLTPSCVSYTDDEILVGEAAKRRLILDPENTIYDMKRLIGRSAIDEIIEQNRLFWTFNIESDKQLRPVVKIPRGKKQIKPEEVSAKILEKMKQTAENSLRKPIGKAVITIPAYFNQAQRRATMDAAQLAELEVIDLITEPAAAAYAYGFHHKQFTNNLLVVDLGGGTFDVVVVKVKNEQFVVAAIGGDTQLGGRDFDNALMDVIAASIKRKYKQNCFTDKKIRQKLLQGCIELKHVLSGANKAKFYIGDLFENIDDFLEFTREELNEIYKKLFKRIQTIVQDTLDDGGINTKEIEEILLIGGSTRIPGIKRLLETMFPGKKLNRSINPDEAVAYGAALCAAQHIKIVQNEQQTAKLIEATPMALGTDLVGGRFGIIIPKNSNLPITKSEVRVTVSNDQTSMSFAIYEGVKSLVIENNCLGRMTIDGITPGPAGSQKVTVTFELDKNGLLKVTANYNDKSVQLEIDITEGIPSTIEIDRLLIEDDIEWRRRSAREALNRTLQQVLYAIRKSNLRPGDKLVTMYSQTLNWYEDNQLASEKSFNEINELLDSSFIESQKVGA